MKLFNNFNPKESIKLVGLDDNFDFLIKLYVSHKLPKTMLLTGKKGQGKSTMINHLLFFIFDKNNYDLKSKKIITKNTFYGQFKENFLPNVLYLSNDNDKKINIEDIRELKKKITHWKYKI